jgi:hypothetical protein
MTPPDCDLRGLMFMPLEVQRLRDSDLALLATGDEFKAAVLLWCASWQQVPAASLPADDRVLCRWSGLDAKAWAKAKAGAMRGWVACDDGRLYHPVVAEKALATWRDRLKYRERRATDRDRLKEWRDRKQDKGGDGNGSETAPETPDETRFETRVETPKGVERSGGEWREDYSGPVGPGAGVAVVDPSDHKQQPQTAAKRGPPPDPNAEAWGRAVAVLRSGGRTSETAARSFFGKLLKETKLEARDLLPSVVACEGKGTHDPQGYLRQAARAVAERRGTVEVTPESRVAGWGDGEWRAAVEMFRDEGRWGDACGPMPDEPGCPAPPAILAEFGFRSENVVPISARGAAA